MQIIKYNEYVIIATAFLDDQRKWIGQARLRPSRETPVMIQTPMMFDNERFDDRHEAEDFALDGAQFFIDTQLKHSGLE